MARYEYRAKERSGEIIHAYVEADSKDDAIEKICQLGYYPISVEDLAAAARKRLGAIPFFSNRQMDAQVTIFTKQLGNLLKSGIPLLRAIGIIAEQSESTQMVAILNGIYTKLKDGGALSLALGDYPKLFDHFFISMVRVGEENGTLADVLPKIVAHRKRQDEIRARIRNALTYPMFVAVVGFFTILFILTNVMPKLVALILSMDVQLPLSTRILIGTSGFLQKYFLLITMVALLVYLVILRMPRQKASRLAIDTFKLHIPYFGKVILQTEFIRFARTLESSLQSGLHLLKSLQLAATVLENELIKKAVSDCHEKVKSGSSLGLCMKKVKVFPLLMSSMIMVGEESGRLPEVLGFIAEDYEAKVEDATKTLMTLLEPAIIVVIGLMVGFIVMSLLLPIFQMDVLIK